MKIEQREPLEGITPAVEAPKPEPKPAAKPQPKPEPKSAEKPQESFNQEVVTMSREREWIHKPVFHGGPASLSLAEKIFRGRLKRFREEHKEFDGFLIDLFDYLKNEQDGDYKNLCLFIEGQSEVNWISPGGGLFDIFIKLFNLCLSPEQAFNYIKQCHEWYLFMLNADYKISDKPEFSIRKDTWDGKHTKFVEVNVLPKEEPENWDYYYWFRISSSLTVIEDSINDVSCDVDKIELVCEHEELHDALMLFSNHQNKPLLRKVFDTAINSLVDSGLIKEIKTKRFYDSIIHYYDTDFKIGVEVSDNER